MAENDSEGYEVHPIWGMESVIATVSGYHGTERFKLIKLIAQTGANYVGSMDRCTTHLVCWQFEGKKFDLARNFGTYIISHRWFEDCLKQGKRLPEGPYIMQSGQEAGPISCEFSDVLDIRGKGKAILEKKRIVLSELSNASSFNEVDVSASYFDIPCSNWSVSPLLNENSFPTLIGKTRGSKKVGSSKRRLTLKSGSKSIGHPEPPTKVLGNQLDDSSSFLSMHSSRKKRSFCDDSYIGATGGSASRNHHLVKKSASDNPVESAILDLQLIQRHNPACVDLENLNGTILPSTQELISEVVATVCEESRRVTLQPNEDIGEQNNFRISIDSDCSGNYALSGPGTSQNEQCVYTEERTDCYDVGDNQNEQGNKSNELGEATCLDSKTGYSCVICFTDFSSTRGVLQCGHRFCYSCIQGWADYMVSKGRISACPLCKTSFSHITKFEATASDDQKIYSQTIQCDALSTGIYMLSSNRLDHHGILPVDSTCYVCHNSDPEDLLACCHICQNRWVHSCCLDPPLFPWTCVGCSDIRLLYQRFH